MVHKALRTTQIGGFEFVMVLDTKRVAFEIVLFTFISWSPIFWRRSVSGFLVADFLGWGPPVTLLLAVGL